MQSFFIVLNKGDFYYKIEDWRFIVKSRSVMSFLFLIFFYQSLFALTGREIMDKSDALPTPKSMKGKLLMFIHKGGRVLEKEFDTLMKEVRGNDRVLMSFVRPTRIKLLTHAKKGQDDDMWLRLSSGKVKRIAATDMDKAFVNSHFYYEDMQSREIDDYNYKYLGDGKASGEDCYKVETIKKTKKKVYDKIIVYIRKSDFFLLRADLYRKGKFYKYVELFDTEVIKGIITPRRVVMTLANGKGYTEIKLKTVKYNIKVRNSKFNKEALR